MTSRLQKLALMDNAQFDEIRQMLMKRVAKSATARIPEMGIRWIAPIESMPDPRITVRSRDVDAHCWRRSGLRHVDHDSRRTGVFPEAIVHRSL